MIQVPYNLWLDWIQNGGSTATRSVTRIGGNHCTNIDHSEYYTPKCKKLLTYPYRSIVVSNNAGQTGTFKWEAFQAKSQSGGNACEFKVMGVPLTDPEIMCYPYEYRGIENDYESGLVLKDFPEPSWSEDSYEKWYAQNKGAYSYGLLASSLLGSLGVIGAAATGGLSLGLAMSAEAGMFINVANQTANMIGGYVKSKDTPDQFYGQASTSSLKTVQRRIGFTFYDMGMEMSKAKVIDGYFNMYGYAMKCVKVPNIRQDGVVLRPHWNYIKTKGCVIKPASGQGLPALDMENIAKVYDSGVTFWMVASEVGNYGLNNNPTS